MNQLCWGAVTHSAAGVRHEARRCRGAARSLGGRSEGSAFLGGGPRSFRRADGARGSPGYARPAPARFGVDLLSAGTGLRVPKAMTHEDGGPRDPGR